ncbi:MULTISPECIES: helix-turn-helix transcriptional regulator [Leuconostoc]|uniref:helix-turn-helix transcriptional regulator n=1 Tax=Leuconostoc suionicum TaxID=1511761 RepID=UPI004035CEFA
MNQIRTYRLINNMSQSSLANTIGVARQTINLIENNKYNPSLSLCIKLAVALHTDLNALFWEERDEI